MMFIPVLVIVLILYLVFRNPDLTRNQMARQEERSPLDILKQRYAEVSISQDEFLRMKEELSNRN